MGGSIRGMGGVGMGLRVDEGGGEEGLGVGVGVRAEEAAVEAVGEAAVVVIVEGEGVEEGEEVGAARVEVARAVVSGEASRVRPRPWGSDIPADIEGSPIL